MPGFYRGGGQNRKRKFHATRRQKQPQASTRSISGTPAPSNTNEEDVQSEDGEDSPALQKKVRWEGRHRANTEDPTEDGTMEDTAEENQDSCEPQASKIDRVRFIDCILCRYSLRSRTDFLDGMVSKVCGTFYCPNEAKHLDLFWFIPVVALVWHITILLNAVYMC